jgi:hypothetical protein
MIREPSLRVFRQTNFPNPIDGTIKCETCRGHCKIKCPACNGGLSRPLLRLCEKCKGAGGVECSNSKLPNEHGYPMSCEFGRIYKPCGNCGNAADSFQVECPDCLGKGRVKPADTPKAQDDEEQDGEEQDGEEQEDGESSGTFEDVFI